VLVFSKTDGYRHESIPDGVNALTAIAAARGWNLSATEDSTRFSTSGLAPFNVVVFLSSAGDILDTSQQAAFEAYVRAGGGWVGIHAASTTEYDWPFFGGLVGAYFSAHPAIQQAVVRVENAMHPSTATLPTVWRRTDEWYSFRTNPRANVTVLLTLDESSYAPGDTAMGSDHPIAWYHVYEGGRSFYTALGHTRESYTEPAFLAHVTGGIEWASKLVP
jgi:type 1 glutamine amidotransferase